jgi:hypothetical protein
VQRVAAVNSLDVAEDHRVGAGSGSEEGAINAQRVDIEYQQAGGCQVILSAFNA